MSVSRFFGACSIFLIAYLARVGALCAENGYTIPIVKDIYVPGASVDSASDVERAAILFVRAKAAAEEGRLSDSLRLVTETLQANPDHADARRVLGYQRHGEAWRTPYETHQYDRGFAWHARFGWIKPEEIPRYEADERRVGKRWVTQEVDDRRHATLKKGWQVRTDRFLVTTNESLEVGVILAGELEQLFQVWRQLFAGYYLGEQEIQARFEGRRTARRRSKPFNVLYHRSKEEYVTALRSRQPRIAETLGIYFDDLRQAHFYHDEQFDHDARRATLYHEAVHQLFQEATSANNRVGAEANYWIVEGIALYFESLQPRKTPEGKRRFVIASPRAGRLPAARHRLLHGGYSVPLAELASLGKDDLQRRADLAPLYSQAAGMTAYLMHGQKGRYREGLIQHLRAVYSGKARQGDLPDRLGIGFGDLDSGYRQFLEDRSP